MDIRSFTNRFTNTLVQKGFWKKKFHDASGKVLSEKHQQKITERLRFLNSCSAATRALHRPLADLYANRGNVSNGHGKSSSTRGQTTVGFLFLEDYREADKAGFSPLTKTKEYGVVQSGPAYDLSEIFRKAHIYDGKEPSGALVFPNGIAPLATLMDVVFQDPPFHDTYPEKQVLLVPEHVYGAMKRQFNFMAGGFGYEDMPADQQKRLAKQIVTYPDNATGEEIQALILKTEREIGAVKMFHFEAPSSKVFGIPHIKEISQAVRALNAKRDKEKEIIISCDSSWSGGPTRDFNPLEYAHVNTESGSKYRTGTGADPLGLLVVDAEHPELFEKISKAGRYRGANTVSDTISNHAIETSKTMERRMDQHYDSALHLIDWLDKQPFVKEIICPFFAGSKHHAQSPDYELFKEYFGKGNGLFTIEFSDNVSQEQIAEFVDAMRLAIVGESWGGPVTLVLPAGDNRLRFSVGLESKRDLERDLAQAAQKAFAHLYEQHYQLAALEQTLEARAD